MALLKTLGAIDFYTNSPNVGCGITSSGVIAGTGSLRVWKGTGDTFVVQAARNTAPYRFVSGYGYFRWKFATSLPDSGRIGYYFLPQQQDVSGTTGRVWSVWLYRDSLSGGRFQLNIHEYPNGLASSNGTTGISVNLTPLYNTLGVVYSVAVKWLLDIPRYGGLWVRAWIVQGSTLPDTTTTPRLEYTFPLSVQLTTFGEGEWYRLQQSGSTCDMIADQVGRYALLVP
jgi:hypothetical protein